MHPSRPSGRGRLIAATLVSLSLHALVGLGWLSARGKGPVGGRGIDVRVDGPDDGETVVVLLDRRPAPPPQVATPPPEPPKVAPNPLPGSVTHRPPTGIDVPSHSGPSPVVPASLPKSGGPKPLHGKLRPGQTVVYVLDRSSSMGVDGLLHRAIDALTASLDQLGPDVRFQVVAYNGGTTSLSNDLLPATPANVERAAHWLKGLPAEGQSRHKAGFQEALGWRPDALLLLTDADDLEWAEVRAISGMVRTPVTISAAVVTGRRRTSASPLAGLVNRTGGSVTYLSGD